MDTVYLNGVFMPAEAATISPRDRGFRFGDGVFETIPFYAGTPYQWAFHIERLNAALKSIHLHVTPDWLAIAEELLAKNNAQSATGFIRISVSRGAGSKGYHPLSCITPSLFVELLPRSDTAATSATLWQSSRCKITTQALPAHKLAALGIHSTLALMEAEANGCDEALLLSADGFVCEAASGNLFWIVGRELFTPALSTGCLNGATRQAIMRLHDTTEIDNATPETLQHAEAVFITNCNWGILPISKLLPQNCRWDVAHPLIAHLQDTYQEDIAAQCHLDLSSRGGI